MERLDDMTQRLARLEERVTAPTLLSRADVAELLGCSAKTVDRRVADGSLPAPVMVGRMKRWRLADLGGAS